LTIEYLDASVAYNLGSATVPLDEVYFPSLTLCNMNTLRRSFVHSLIDDPKLQVLNVSFQELKKIIHLVFINGDDYQLNSREIGIVESKITYTNLT
jgi:hypothetical protein